MKKDYRAQTHMGDTPGVFDRTVNRAAFADRVVLNAWGTKRKRCSKEVTLLRNFPIGGPGRLYGRCQHGLLAVNGNPIDCIYGSLRKAKKAPPFRIALRSETTPLTCAQVIRAAGSFLRRGFRLTLSLIEVTFDLELLSLAPIGTHVFGKFREYTTKGGLFDRSTLYYGSPKSPVQVRIYRKGAGIIRFEFILRARFLRHHGLMECHDVLALNRVGLWQLATLQDFREEELRAVLRSRTSSWRKDLLLHWPASLPLKHLADCLRHQWGIDPKRFLKPSPIQVLLEAMVRKLIW